MSECLLELIKATRKVRKTNKTMGPWWWTRNYMFENKVFDNQRFKKSYVVNGIRIDEKSLEYTSTE